MRVINTTGYISTYAGNGGISYTSGSLATNTGIGGTSGLAFVGNDKLYIAAGTRHNYPCLNLVLKVTRSTGIINTIAGTGIASSTGDGGPAISATFNRPWALAFDPLGNLYMSEYLIKKVRRIVNAAPVFPFPPPLPLPPYPPPPDLKIYVAATVSPVVCLILIGLLILLVLRITFNLRAKTKA